MGIRPGKDDPYRLRPETGRSRRSFSTCSKCDPETARVRDFVELVPDMTPEQVLAEAKDPETTFARIRELWILTNQAFGGVTFTEGEAEERLLDILTRLGNERRAAEEQERAQQPKAARAAAKPAALAPAEVEALGEWALMLDEITRPEDEEARSPGWTRRVESGDLDQVTGAAVRRRSRSRSPVLRRLRLRDAWWFRRVRPGCAPWPHPRGHRADPLASRPDVRL